MLSIVVLALMSGGVRAACPNQAGSVILVGVGQTIHVMIDVASSCVATSGATVSASVHSTITPDATGWNITGITPGNDTITWTPSNLGLASAVYNVTVTATPTVVVLQ
jgi:hypothetical protein